MDMNTAFKKSGWTVEEMKAHLKSHFGVDDSSKLTSDQLELLIQNLKSGKTAEQAKSLPGMF